MSKEEWAQVKNALGSLFESVKLNIDNYEVVIRLVRISTYKNGIAVYINGVFNASWLFEDCEERKRFFPIKEKSLLTAKQKSSWKKYSKKIQKEFTEKYDKKYEYYSSYWTSFAALKKHFITNNQSIELIEIN